MRQEMRNFIKLESPNQKSKLPYLLATQGQSTALHRRRRPESVGGTGRKRRLRGVRICRVCKQASDMTARATCSEKRTLPTY